MVALRAWLGTHERGDTFFHGRSSRVVFLFEKLPELILGTPKLCLTLLPLLLLILFLQGLRLSTNECGNLIFLGRCSRVVLFFEALLELILGTTKLCLTLLLLLMILRNALRSRTPV